MHEHIATPDYPHTAIAFTYRGLEIEITTSLHQDEIIYSAWVNYAMGSAVAVPRASSKKAAIAQAKKWIQTHFSESI
jgi:hypothetical protein